MQNLEKSNEIKRLCTEILMQVGALEDTKTGSYFDYESTLEMLEQAIQLMENTQRYPRPENLPHILFGMNYLGMEKIMILMFLLEQ